MRIALHGVIAANKGLAALAAGVSDLRPFWRHLGSALGTTIQARWPLRRRTGRLRKSLTWSGDRLGKGGIYEPTPDRLTFGSAVFYGRFFQHGTKRQAAQPLIHIDEAEHAEQLGVWLRARASAAGLEVEQ